MFPKIFLTAIVVALPVFLIAADVTPVEPAPGALFTAGGNCNLNWDGDTSSTTAWKAMTVQLMTGSNDNMIPLTTVVQNLDGTTSGSYSWTCPPVTPPAAIYFYQFTSPNAPDKQWTGRFTIATSSGQTAAAPNATQPDTGEQIAWGAGVLNSPSSAIPPPAYLSSGSTTSPSTNSTSTSSSSVVIPGTSTVATAPPTSVGPSVNSPSGFTTVVVTTSVPSTTAASSTSTNGATLYTPFMHNLLLSVCGLFFTVLF